LGLSVVHGIVLGHNGAILVESRPGLGTAIEVVLPAVFSPEMVREKPKDSDPEHGQGRVVVGDDDRDFGDMLSLMLKRNGWSVSYFDDPFEALKAVSDEPGYWNLLITDQAMPGMRGQDLIRKIKEGVPELPCILCSGFDETLDEETARRTGASALVHKPVTAKQFMGVVSKVMKMACNPEG
jgi:DNA-binding NtrC family response regulator